MEMTRERISFTFDPRDMLLSLQMGFSFVRAAVTCSILERTSGLEPSYETTVTGHFGPKPSRPLDTSAPSHLGPKPSRPHLEKKSWTPRPLVRSAPSHLGPTVLVTSAPV